ncbi:MAG: hypothetical protein WC783_01040 [Candidatus Paceibacterota bacterium]|jgi:hypothetical protein
MASIFTRKYITRPEDTSVYFYVDHILRDPIAVHFTVYYVDGSVERMIGVPEIEATRVSTGVWYARFQIPEDAPYGDYRLDFTYTQRSIDGSDIESSVSQLFEVASMIPVTMTASQITYADSLRTLLRDNNPDAYYRFAPPVATNIISGFTEEKGYLWQDEELLVFIDIALASFESTWTASGASYDINRLSLLNHRYKAYVLYVAAAEALFAEAVRWISEEFTYDVEGHSLSIDRHSKFETMAGAFYDRAEKELEKIQGGTLFVRGVKARYGISRGAALGPRISGPGLLSYLQSSRYK